ncbi:MAG: hypothetical protein ACI8RZ_007973 [Myxococcota bacterium]|jgi:hypothetical protein
MPYRNHAAALAQLVDALYRLPDDKRRQVAQELALSPESVERALEAARDLPDLVHQYEGGRDAALADLQKARKRARHLHTEIARLRCQLNAARAVSGLRQRLTGDH